MRPIVVSVGPLAAASAGLAPTQQPPGPGQIRLGTTNPAGGSATRGYNGTVTLAAGVMTVNTVTLGAVVPGMRMSSLGWPPNATVIGPAPGSIAGGGVGSTWIVYPAATFAVQQAVGNPLFTYDQPRQILITTTEPPGNSFTIYGFDAAGSPIQETLLTNGGSLTTQQNFAQVNQITAAAATVGTLLIGSAPTASSPWVNFDPWAGASISEQLDVVGVANYTVQISNDDPSSPTNPTPPGQMTWLPDPNAALVGASTPQFGVWAFVPLWARILLNSGAGSVTGTFVQTGSVSR
jgi:hypothetical protein